MFATDGKRTVALPESPDFPPRFAHVFAEVLEHWHQVFRSLRVPVLPLSTARPAVDQIRELVGAHLHS
jgi:hypothetical protein